MTADPSLVPAPSAPSEQELDALFARHEAASLINLDTAIRLNALRFNGRDYDYEIAGHRADILVWRWLRSRLPVLLAAARDKAAMHFLSSNCCSVTLRDSAGEEREFAREYFSADDDFREFMRCLPAEYEGLLSAAVSSSGSVEHG